MHRDRESWGNSDDRDNGVANVIFWGRGDHVEDAARDEGASCYWNDCWGGFPRARCRQRHCCGDYWRHPHIGEMRPPWHDLARPIYVTKCPDNRHCLGRTVPDQPLPVGLMRLMMSQGRKQRSIPNFAAVAALQNPTTTKPATLISVRPIFAVVAAVTAVPRQSPRHGPARHPRHGHGTARTT